MNFEPWYKVFANQVETLTLSGEYRYLMTNGSGGQLWPETSSVISYLKQRKTRSGVRIKPDPIGYTRKGKPIYKQGKVKYDIPLHRTCFVVENTLTPGRYRIDRGSCDGNGRPMPTSLNSYVSSDYALSAWLSPTLPNELMEVYSSAYVELYNAYEDSQAQLLSFLAEGQQAAEQIVNMAQALETSFLYALNGSFMKLLPQKVKFTTKTYAKFLAAAANLWLEWSFGIKPLLNDIKSLAEAIAEASLLGTPPVRVHGKAHKNVVSHVPDSGSGALFIPGFEGVPLIVDIETRTHVKQKLGGRVDPLRVLSSLDTAGLSPNEVLPALWEAIPYSWLVDYFTNLGDLVALMISPANFSLNSPWEILVLETTITQVSRVPTVFSNNGYEWVSKEGSSASTVQRIFSFTGDPWAMKFPDLTFTGLDLSPIRELNLAAVHVTKAAGSATKVLRHKGG